MVRRGIFLPAWAVWLLAIGCGPKGPEVVPVTGRVTKEGKPVSNVLIHFLPEKGRTSSARTDSDGRFELQFSKDIPYGAVPGKHKVYFTMEQGRVDQPVNLDDPQYHPQMREILQKYGSYQNSPLRVEVDRNSPELTIELE